MFWALIKAPFFRGKHWLHYWIQAKLSSLSHLTLNGERWETLRLSVLHGARQLNNRLRKLTQSNWLNSAFDHFTFIRYICHENLWNILTYSSLLHNSTFLKLTPLNQGLITKSIVNKLLPIGFWNICRIYRNFSETVDNFSLSKNTTPYYVSILSNFRCNH